MEKDIFTKKLGKRIASVREEKELTQVQLGKLVKQPKQNIYRRGRVRSRRGSGAIARYRRVGEAQPPGRFPPSAGIGSRALLHSGANRSAKRADDGRPLAHRTRRTGQLSAGEMHRSDGSVSSELLPLVLDGWPPCGYEHHVAGVP